VTDTADSRSVVEEEAEVMTELEMTPEANGIQLQKLLYH
jgi:hypothetical protein